MSIYLNEKNPSKHKPFDDASQDIVDYLISVKTAKHLQRA